MDCRYRSDKKFRYDFAGWAENRENFLLAEQTCEAIRFYGDCFDVRGIRGELKSEFFPFKLRR